MVAMEANSVYDLAGDMVSAFIRIRFLYVWVSFSLG